MNKYIAIVTINFVLLNLLTAQVCCSLVGAIDHGGGASSTQWEAQWPSHFDDHSSYKWLIGFNSTHTVDNDLNIRYGTALSSHIQVSHYIGQKSLGYFQMEASWLQLEESLSFSQSESDVQQLGLRFGIRHLLTKNMGFVFGEFSLPNAPTFSNNDFAFTTGAVPTFTTGWMNRFQTPFFERNNTFFPDVATSISYSKNLRNQENVFMDDAVAAHLSSSIYLAQAVSLSPFTTLLSQKLIAPLSPWDTERQTRWLSVINFGVDLTPSHHKWNWLHLRFTWPIYRWSSNGNFPDGTEPVPRVGLSVNTGGLFN